jgi:hypothetical protein
VPITQLRMQNVLDENQSLVAHIEQLRADAEGVAGMTLRTEEKLKVILHMIFEPRPQTTHSEQEREHFVKATARNVAQARRMRERRNRQQVENENELD